MMAYSFWIVKPLINCSNIMHKHLQPLSIVFSSKILRYGRFDMVFFSECTGSDRFIHSTIFLLGRFYDFQKRDFAIFRIAIMAVPISVRSHLLTKSQNITAGPDFPSVRTSKQRTKYSVTTTQQQHFHNHGYSSRANSLHTGSLTKRSHPCKSASSEEESGEPRQPSRCVVVCFSTCLIRYVEADMT